jgi:hypothetical protein
MKIKLNDVRLSFPDIWTAVEYEKGDGKPRYNASYLITPGSENDKVIRAAIKQVAIEKYGKKADSLLAAFAGVAQKMCYLDGNLKDYDGYEDMMALTAHRKEKDGRPFVCDGSKNPLTESDGKPYAGCYVNATVDIYAQDAPNIGIRAGIVGLQFVRDGDSFGGTSKGGADDFEDISAPDESSAFDDDIPF